MEFAEDIEAIATDDVVAIEPVSLDGAHSIMERSFEHSSRERHIFLDTQLDATLESFSGSALREVRAAIAIATENENGVSILEQGCGDGSALKKLVRQIRKKTPDKKVSALGVTASLEKLKWEASENARRGQAAMRVMRSDVHIGLDELHNEFEIIFSDNTYRHLPFAWATWAKTCQRLGEGGIAIMRTLPNHLFTIDGDRARIFGFDDYIERVRWQNPAHNIFGEVDARDERFGIVAVQRTNGARFESGLHFGKLQWRSGTMQPCSVFIPAGEAKGDFVGL